MKEHIREKRAQAILKDRSKQDPFVLDDTMVRAARHKNTKEKREERADCELVPIPRGLITKCRESNHFFLTWNVWFRLVLKLKSALRQCSSAKERQTNGETIFSLSYEQRPTFHRKFDNWGFVFKICQPRAAEILKKEFGILSEMMFPHPDPLIMYTDLICEHDLLSHKK